MQPVQPASIHSFLFLLQAVSPPLLFLSLSCLVLISFPSALSNIPAWSMLATLCPRRLSCLGLYGQSSIHLASLVGERIRHVFKCRVRQFPPSFTMIEAADWLSVHAWRLTPPQSSYRMTASASPPVIPSINSFKFDSAVDKVIVGCRPDRQKIKHRLMKTRKPPWLSPPSGEKEASVKTLTHTSSSGSSSCISPWAAVFLKSSNLLRSFQNAGSTLRNMWVHAAGGKRQVWSWSCDQPQNLSNLFLTLADLFQRWSLLIWLHQSLILCDWDLLLFFFSIWLPNQLFHIRFLGDHPGFLSIFEDL